jgi:hypothetical protein
MARADDDAAPDDNAPREAAMEESGNPMRSDEEE